MLVFKIFMIFVVICGFAPVAPRSYNNGLIFYDLNTRQAYLPPTVSVSRGRGLASVKFSAKGSIWSTFGKPCECHGNLCGCCAGLKVKQFKFDQKMCANVTYVAPENEARLDVFLNEKASSSYGISVDDPAPFCIPVMMGVPMAMCVQLSEIGTRGNNLHMCMDFVVRLATTDLFEMHFQCMQMGMDGVQYIDKDGATVLPSVGKTENDEEDGEYYDNTEDAAENEISYEKLSGAEVSKLPHKPNLDKLQSPPDLINMVDSNVYQEKIQQQMLNLQNVQQMQIGSEPSVAQGQIDDEANEDEEQEQEQEQEQGYQQGQGQQYDQEQATEEGGESSTEKTTTSSNYEYYELEDESTTTEKAADRLIETITASIERATTMATVATTPNPTTASSSGYGSVEATLDSNNYDRESSSSASSSNTETLSSNAPTIYPTDDSSTAQQEPAAASATTAFLVATAKPIAAPLNMHDETTAAVQGYGDGPTLATYADAKANITANDDVSTDKGEDNYFGNAADTTSTAATARPTEPTSSEDDSSYTHKPIMLLADQPLSETTTNAIETISQYLLADHHHLQLHIPAATLVTTTLNVVDSTNYSNSLDAAVAAGTTSSPYSFAMVTTSENSPTATTNYLAANDETQATKFGEQVTTLRIPSEIAENTEAAYAMPALTLTPATASPQPPTPPPEIAMVTATMSKSNKRRRTRPSHRRRPHV